MKGNIMMNKTNRKEKENKVVIYKKMKRRSSSNKDQCGKVI